MGKRPAATSATVTGLAQGTNYYWQVRATNTAGDTEADNAVWRTFATQPGADPARGLLEDLAGERRDEPALARHAEVGCERGRNRVPVVHLDCQRIVHVCIDQRHAGDSDALVADDLLLAGRCDERRRDDARKRRHLVELQDEVASCAEPGGAAPG